MEIGEKEVVFVGGHGVVGKDVLLFLPACLLVDGACLAVMCDILGQVGSEEGVVRGGLFGLEDISGLGI